MKNIVQGVEFLDEIVVTFFDYDLLHKSDTVINKRTYPYPADKKVIQEMWEKGSHADKQLLMGMLGAHDLLVENVQEIITNHIEKEFANQLQKEKEMMLFYGKSTPNRRTLYTTGLEKNDED